jgi:hypothetical protein
MTILLEPVTSSDRTYVLEAWSDAYNRLSLRAEPDPPEVAVRTGDRLAVLEVPAPLGGPVCGELTQLMQPAPVLRTGDRWLFFTEPAGAWPRGTAYTALLAAGAVLREQWSRIVLPSSGSSAPDWIVEPGGGLPRLSVVSRAVRKAHATQVNIASGLLGVIADAPDDQRLTVIFPDHPPLRYRIGSAVAAVVAHDLAARCRDAAVAVDSGPVTGLRRYPCEALWHWRV